MNVKDPLSLEQDLRDVWIGSYNLFIVLARFVDGEKVYRKEEKQWQPVKGKEVQLDKFVENMEPQKKSEHIGTSGGGARSFEDTLINKEVEHVVTEVYVDEKMISGMSDYSFTIKYVGGFQVVLVFDNSKEKDEFLEKKEGWSSCFDSLEAWRGQVCEYEKIAWLKIYGIPLRLLTNQVCNDIGSQFGVVVQSGSFDQEEGDLSCDKFSIIVEEESSDWIPDCLVDLEEEINVVDSQEVPKADGNEEGDRSMVEDETIMGGDVLSEGGHQSTGNKVLNDNEGPNVATSKFKGFSVII
ncbi:hypothetical protein Hanom_Chr11g00988901 [Helianthus anomalus]